MDILLEFSQIKFFSLYGLIAAIVILIPNFAFAKKGQKNRPDDVDSCGAGICFLELLSRAVLTIVLICIRMPLSHIGFGLAAAVALIVYYCLWINFFRSGSNYPDIYVNCFLGLPVPFDVFRNVYFICISLWLSNFYALIAAVVYACCNLANAVKAMKDLSSRKLS